jgi:SpoVK/Ycf46/Vps4 family AAA+-type ATPase
MGLKNDLSRYLDAGFPILYINTFEDTKVEELIKTIDDRKRLFVWSLAKGYGEYSIIDNEWSVPLVKDESTNLNNVLNLKLIDDSELNRSIFIIKDVHVVLEDKEIVSQLKEIATRISAGLDCNIILLSSVMMIPKELEKYITILENDYLTFDDITSIIKKFLIENGLSSLSEQLIEEMAIAFKGLTEFEILNLLALSVADDGDLTKKDLKLIFEQKQQMIKKSGILEMVPVKESIDDIGGLENLKKWLQRKAIVYKNMKKAERFGVDMPKGVLVAGIPGCGKSLCAKAVASLFEVPILRLDVGKLMGKYLGESEANLRKAINMADAISPCVLWIDELEKAFAGIGSESGHEVTIRLFGTFLTWMQEKTSSTFVVATANDITKLPPELLRKGRFDEIFFVDLPNKEEREKILSIHIKKRRSNDYVNLEKEIGVLASMTEGYSGADIEGVIKDSVEYAFVQGNDRLTSEDIKEAIRNTNSLSVIMKDSISQMRKEYDRRKLKNASK